MRLKQLYEDKAGEGTGAGGGAGAGAAAGAAGGAAAGAGSASGQGGAAGAAGAGSAGAGAAGAAGRGAGEGGAGEGGAGAGEGGQQPTWPEDWRQRYSGEDVKKMERLSRYASPAAAFDALLSLQSRIGAGELRSNLPKNPTAEQIAQWRTENGIPEAPDKYDLTGVTVDPEDKPMIDSFLAKLHGVNAPTGVAKEAVAWYYEEAARRTEERLQQDAEIAKTNEDALRAEWNQEYRPNMNMINGLLDTMPADARDLFKGGRLANGNPLMSDPGVLRALVAWSRQINPVTTLVPNAGANVSGAIDEEIAAIEKLMRTDRKAYNQDEKKQQRLRDLYDARERASGKR